MSAGPDLLVDVALVPAMARGWPPAVCLVIDQLRASTTIVTLLDRGCSELLLTAGLARRGLVSPASRPARRPLEGSVPYSRRGRSRGAAPS